MNMDSFGSSYQNGGGSVREADFQRLSQNIGTNIQKILQNGKIFNFIAICNFDFKRQYDNSCPNLQLFDIVLCLHVSVASMQRMIVQIGTPQDNHQLQSQL